MAAASLPAQPGPLVGRADELARLTQALTERDVRLLTLAGPAGTGKTRLAVEVAGAAAENFADGTYFVDLAPISDASLVPTAIARVLAIREERDRPLLQVLQEHLAESSTLLVLDNFEQLLPAAPQLSELVQSCSALKLLVTSRSALRLRWEHVFPVPPLQPPAAVELFVQRAQRVNPIFRLDESNADTVGQICARLDGLPLAIELAAARTRVLPPIALLSRLERRLELLATPTADQPMRQRTLRAALDWSYDLLSPAEQTFFRRLGVFVGGFPLGAVQEVCDPDGALDLDALTAVELLVDKSLIRHEQTLVARGEPRFGLLETVRDYALERLSQAGEVEQTRRRHSEYYLLGADAPVAEMKLAQQTVWLQSLEAEHDNLRAALAWCAQTKQPELGLSAASLLGWFWIVRGYVLEGRRTLAELLNLMPDTATALRAEGLRVLGSLALHQSDYRSARAHFEQSLALRIELGEPAGLLSALSSLGAVALQQGEIETAEGYFEKALAIQMDLDDSVGIAESLNNLANVAHERGDLGRARDLYERSLGVQQQGVRYRPDVVLHNLGVVALEQGDPELARRRLEDSVAMRRAVGDTAGLALSLAKLGEVLSAIGDGAAAHRLLCESLSLQRDLGDRSGMAFVLERFGMAAAARGQPAQALRIAAAAESLRDAIGVPLGPGARSSHEYWLSAARAALSADEAERAWSEGRSLTLEQALSLAAQFESRTGDDSRTITAGAPLTPREREVAVLIAQGLSNRDIAQQLVVSERTAENHVQHVLNRLGLRSRAQVAAWAVHNGLTS